MSSAQSCNCCPSFLTLETCLLVTRSTFPPPFDVTLWLFLFTHFLSTSTLFAAKLFQALHLNGGKIVERLFELVDVLDEIIHVFNSYNVPLTLRWRGVESMLYGTLRMMLGAGWLLVQYVYGDGATVRVIWRNVILLCSEWEDVKNSTKWNMWAYSYTRRVREWIFNPISSMRWMEHPKVSHVSSASREGV